MAGEIVDVCVCTFRRETLTSAIRSLGALAPGSPRVRLVVVDNDDAPSAKVRAEAAAADAGLELTYLHAPARNISIARNAGLDAASADWLAFIDDDEEVTPEWLSSLIQARESADIVFGPVVARYRSDAPEALRRAELHTTVPPPGRALVTGYSGNVIMRRAAVEEARLRFDHQFGVSGGEDTVFFYSASQKGLRLRFAMDALVFEDVPEAREKWGWIWRRRMLAGEAFGFCQHRVSRKSRLPIVASAVAKSVALGVMTFVTLIRPHVALRNGARLGFHLGVLAYCLRSTN